MVYINDNSLSSILFVDDEPILCELVSRMLEERPYRVFTADSPDEGLSLLDENLMDLVISDYKMKQMDGLEFLQSVQQKQPAADRVIVTGYSRMDVFIEAIKQGKISRILHKPWDRNEFLKIVDESVQRKKPKILRSDPENRYKRYAQEMEVRVEERTRELGFLIDTLQSRNEKLEKMHQQLQRSGKMASLGYLASTLVEDIKNPLGVIKSDLNVFRSRNNLSQTDYELLERVVEQANRINSLLSGITEFSEKSHKSLQPVNLVDSLGEALVMTQHLLSENEIEVINSFPETTPMVFGDPVRIAQLFMNIIQNAAQVMPNGGQIHCEILPTKMHQNQNPRKAWQISISDTGPGIPPAEINHIFEAFYTSRKNGAGLGLNLCKQIVEEHDGVIEVESEPSFGTTFRIILLKHGNKKNE